MPAMLRGMDSIENFLLARIAEDEMAAAAVSDPLRSRVLDQLTAVRRAVAIRRAALKAKEPFRTVPDYDLALWDMLTVLALPYADHPDYASSLWRSERMMVEPEPNRPPLLRPLEGRIAPS